MSEPVPSSVHLGPLRLGSLVLDFPVVQAALSGHSDRPMRVLARRHGAPYTVHEVMLERFVREVGTRPRSRRQLGVSDDEHPIGAQLMGSEPSAFAPAALRLVRSGFDVIDINFGCPVRKAMGGCRGGYHLGQPDVALEIVRAVRDAVPASVPVTVKMRRGIDSGAKSRDEFFEILTGAFEAGVAAVTVHGRTVEQKYEGQSDWGFLREVKQVAGSRVVLGSGDLFSAAACLRMIAETGVDGVSVARGAIGNPWIFSQCRALADGRPLPAPPDVHEQRDVLRAHRTLAEEAVHGRPGLPSTRRYAIKCARHHPDHAQVRNAFGRVRNAQDWEETLAAWYDENQPGRAQ